MSRTQLVAAALAAALVPQEQAKPAFVDPKPPAVAPAPPTPAPEARSYSELTFHRAPKPRAAGAIDEDWPTFLGPRRDGHTRETGLAAQFSEHGPPLVWEMSAGSGFASPVVTALDGGRPRRLVFTHRIAQEIHVDCLDPESGQRYWRFSYPTEYRDRYIPNDGPRSTPVIAGGRVFVHGVENDFFCLDLASGSVLWKRDLAQEFSVPLDFFGAVASPLVVGELVIQNLGAPNGPCVAAFDGASGKLVWGAGKQWGASCASPVLGSVRGRERLFVLAGGESRPPTGGLMVLDPASGALEFEYPFRSKTVESVTGSSPVLAGDKVFMSSSYGKGSACLAAKEDGSFSELWTERGLGLQFSTALYEQGHLWMIDGVADRAGALVCLDPATGKERSRTDLVWEETFELGGVKRTLTYTVGEGSLLHAEGRFLCLGDNGHLLWIDATPERATIGSRAALFRANETWTPPVVSHGLLYVRQTKRALHGAAPPRLLCYDLRAP